jgi:hypothetical protein
MGACCSYSSHPLSGHLSSIPLYTTNREIVRDRWRFSIGVYTRSNIEPLEVPIEGGHAFLLRPGLLGKQGVAPSPESARLTRPTRAALR